jgi:hypothetical protein
LKKLNDVAHKLSLSLSLSLSPPFLKSQTQLCEALIIQAAAAPTTQIHDKNAKVDRKKKKKKKTPSKPTKPNPTATDRHSLTHSLTPFTKMKFLCKFLAVSAVFFFKDTHSGRRKSTPENTIFFSRENIKKAGERKSFNKNPTKKKKTETKKTLDKERSKSFQKQKKNRKIVHTQPKNKQ